MGPLKFGKRLAWFSALALEENIKLDRDLIKGILFVFNFENISVGRQIREEQAFLSFPQILKITCLRAFRDKWHKNIWGVFLLLLFFFFTVAVSSNSFLLWLYMFSSAVIFLDGVMV